MNQKSKKILKCNLYKLDNDCVKYTKQETIYWDFKDRNDATNFLLGEAKNRPLDHTKFALPAPNARRSSLPPKANISQYIEAHRIVITLICCVLPTFCLKSWQETYNLQKKYSTFPLGSLVIFAPIDCNT